MTTGTPRSTHLYIVTGASRGLGASLVRALLKPGNRIIGVARSRNTDLEREATASGVPVAWHLQDLSQPGPSAGWLASVLEAVDDAPASVTLILNLIADLLYAALDPRISYR